MTELNLPNGEVINVEETLQPRMVAGRVAGLRRVVRIEEAPQGYAVGLDINGGSLRDDGGYTMMPLGGKYWERGQIGSRVGS